MKYCTKCGKELMDEAVVCPQCGCATEAWNVKKAKEQDDEINVGLCVLSAFLPLFGIIYWIVKNQETPRRARACGITAIASIAVSIVLNIIGTIMLATFFGGLLSSLL
jgi:uncharacterized membrane protein YvbJ